VAAHPIEQLLAEADQLSHLSDGARRAIIDCARRDEFQAGALVAREGGPATCFFLIHSGRLALETRAASDDRITIETLSGGELVGWSWLYPPFRWHFDVWAREHTTVVRVEAVCLRSKIEADPALGYELVQLFTPLILERLQRTRLRLLDVYRNPGG
jgi:CRP/FNR family transcriptional regulator, cyclic AMP receptor protein